MNTVKTALLGLMVLACSTMVSAQQLLPGSFSFSHKKTAYLTMENGKEVKGTLKSLDRKKGLIEEIKFVTEDGKKMKIKPEDVKSMYLPQSAMDKLANAMDFGTDIQQWDNPKVESELIKDGYAYFEKSDVMIKKKERTMLMMLLNPSFSSKVKIFLDPFANETASVGVGGMTLAGGDEKSYYVKKGNDTAFLLKKKDYDEEFKTLFKDCEGLLKMNPDGAKWGDFSTHVYTYTVECN